ncbi:hypothetical protein CPB84DRAFT_1777455 [Gymnopilus junonius]|uniref:Uncharacterized protein n=1 Tax=Gymnopilus junonius TaxID=109634 RepID=A0A9P5NRH9_GYMJU|nr:hypothetical protein CPB84DRAFT_1777455 [Gymnopilus junonius]
MATSKASQDTRVVLITGCSNGGIGAGLATEFSQNGFLVFASARSLSSMSELGDNIRKLELDVTSDTSCENAVKTIYAEAGHIDVLVSNAGVANVGALLDIPLETAQKVMDTNLYGTVRLVHLIAPQMVNRGRGLIVPVGSTAGELSVPFMGYYNISKAALHAYSETLKEELRPFGVNVMLLVPGTVISKIADNEAKRYETNIPDDSFYRGYKEQMTHVLYYGQNASPWPTDKFAKAVVRAALSSSPPTFLHLGGTTTLWAFLKWLPRPMALRMIWNSTVGNVTNK